MRVLLFYHSLLSDWNHGNAHFLRGIATELIAQGHEVQVYEPRDSWSVRNLLANQGVRAIKAFHQHYPRLKARRYDLETLDLDRALADAEMVLVHEWNDPALVARIGAHRKRVGGYRLFFHDTHHRMVTAPETMAVYELSGYDGVLAYGRTLQEMYEKLGTVRRAWTWHEAADTRLFKPITGLDKAGQFVWIGNWGDNERAAELQEFLIQPIRELGLRSKVYGVRYPDAARQALQQAGIDYGGWLANFDVPQAFATHSVTVHIPRRPYVAALPGIPTIRPFEALACGIALVSSPWPDVEGLFRAGQDYLVASNGTMMKKLLRQLVHEPELRASLGRSGRERILQRHTCAHRVHELMRIYEEAGGGPRKTQLREALNC